MKLTYWRIEHATDSNCYDIRSRTKKGAIAEMKERGASNYSGVVEKITLEYLDSFDLADSLLGESRGGVIKIEGKSYGINS